ncbi:LAFA_0G07228g1_1 [Lachancea sp. 'fantastica']|nr:LAFA_0G07228g1_1 [Lachancea sp. 'fantastica']
MDAVLKCFESGYSDFYLVEFLRFDSAPLGGNLDLKYVRDDKLVQLIQCTLELKGEYASHYAAGQVTPRLFELCNEQLKLLNRLSDGETAWITGPLWISARQLLKISTKLDDQQTEFNNSDSKQKTKQRSKGDLEEEKYLEKCVRTIHTSFKLCLNDRNPVAQENKKWGVYFFTNLELRIYQQLHNGDMIRNLVKVIESRAAELPTPEQALWAHKAQLVTYYHYMARYFGCYEMDYERGFLFAQKAWLASRRRAGRQENAICVLLIPFAVLARRWYPDLATLRSICPAVAEFYRPVVECLRNGDLLKYEKWLNANEPMLLRRNLFVALVAIRELIVRKLVKRTLEITRTGPIVPLRLVSSALVYSESRLDNRHRESVSEATLDSTECVLANLIAKGYVKGYLSHSNRALVVSKTNAFPGMVQAQLKTESKHN